MASRKKRGASSAARPARKRSDSIPDTSGNSGLRKASLFMNGRSQAVRLPKEFRFEGSHVYAKKDGNRVILSPVDDRMERLMALIGSSPDFPDVTRDEPEPMRADVKEYFGVSD
jgi:antitoxin VapB